MGTKNNTKQYILATIPCAFIFCNFVNADERIKEFGEEQLVEKILLSDPKNIYLNKKSDELIVIPKTYELTLEPEDVKIKLESLSLGKRLTPDKNIISKENSTKLNQYGLIRFNNIDQEFLIDGTIIINFKNFPDLNNFAYENNIIFKSSFKSIGSASFKVKQLTDLEALLNDLKNDSNINRVSIDYKDHRISKE